MLVQIRPRFSNFLGPVLIFLNFGPEIHLGLDPFGPWIPGLYKSGYTGSYDLSGRGRRTSSMQHSNALFFDSDVVIPIFIFTPEQIENEKNSFKSSNAVQELVSTLASRLTSLESHERHLVGLKLSRSIGVPSVRSSANLDKVHD